MSAGASGQLQELHQQLQALEAQREELEGAVESLQSEKTEIDEAIEGLEKLETGSVVHVPLGGDSYVRASIEDIDEIVVELGGGFAAEETRDEAIDTLENKQARIDDRIEEIQGEISDVKEQRQQLQQQAQQAQQQMIQEAAQRQQGGGESE